MSNNTSPPMLLRKILNAILNEKALSYNEISNTYSRSSLTVGSVIEAMESSDFLTSSLLISRLPKQRMDKLFEKYGSDKGGWKSNNFKEGQIQKPFSWEPHTYSFLYSLLFAPLRHKAKVVFENGIGSTNIKIPANMTANGRPGASLRAWREYFPNACIYGSDIDKNILFREKRIKTCYVDQYSKESIEAMIKSLRLRNIDIAIDDGIHSFDGCISLFKQVYAKLRRGGIYVIEDVQPSSLIEYNSFFGERNLNVFYWLGFRAKKLDLIGHSNTGGDSFGIDDNILVLIVKD